MVLQTISLCSSFLAAGPLSVLLCMKNRRSAANALQNDLQHANLVHVSVWWRQTPRRRREGAMSVLPVLCSLAGLCQRTPDTSVQVREGSCWARDRREGVWRSMFCCLHRPPEGPVWQQFGEAQPSTCCQRSPDSCCWDETLRTIIKPYAGELRAHTGAWECLNWCG